MHGLFSLSIVVCMAAYMVSCTEWTAWDSWGSCTVTCGKGTQFRNRTCPQITCSPGNNTEIRTCFIRGCLDGQWSNWGTWSQCSMSTQMRSRTRLCANPAPTLYGMPCEGIAEQFTACQGSNTAAPSVLFTAHHPVDREPKVGTNIIYSEIINNEGQGYDNTTGNFTVPVSGVYSFYVQLCTGVSRTVAIQLIANNVVVGVMDRSSEQYGCSSTHAVIRILKGAVVKVVVTDTARYGIVEASARWNIFSGHLLHT